MKEGSGAWALDTAPTISSFVVAGRCKDPKAWALERYQVSLSLVIVTREWISCLLEYTNWLSLLFFFCGHYKISLVHQYSRVDLPERYWFEFAGKVHNSIIINLILMRFRVYLLFYGFINCVVSYRYG